MAWLNRSDPPDLPGLARRLRRLGRVFPIDAIRAGEFGSRQIVDYYEQCHGAYRKHHSAEGAVHMALNEDGRFDPDGFYAPLRRIEAAWPATAAHDVLELGFGQGFNLAYLASRHRALRFAGIDLTPSHLALASRRIAEQGLPNVSLALGDFHHLAYADRSFDQVFAIETFCHATDTARAFAEVARVLRPGGCFTLFDGYLIRRMQQCSADEALAAELVAKGMAIEQLQDLQAFLQQARRAGLEAQGVTVLDAQVMPTLRRLERLTGAVIRFPWLGRRALARRPPMRGRNVLAGYLLRSAVALGVIGYRQIVLQKRPVVTP